MIISLVVAASENNVIGSNNQLPWHLPNDLKFFKNTTWAMPIVMGRKTFESMGNKPLKGRLNIIITKQKNWQADGVVIVNSFDDALFVTKSHFYKEMFVVGGGEIFEQTIQKAQKIYLTRVHTKIEGNIFFPEIDTNKWLLKSSQLNPSDDKHLYSYSFELWEKK